jgi:hypothetical protein
MGAEAFELKPTGNTSSHKAARSPHRPTSHAPPTRAGIVPLTALVTITPMSPLSVHYKISLLHRHASVTRGPPRSAFAPKHPRLPSAALLQVLQKAECHICYLRDSGLYVHESCCPGNQRHLPTYVGCRRFWYGPLTKYGS